ncbi:CDP-diacylglycerol--glycerol-3-phosphate 3-phosphatidyltransferase [Mobilisporobacter senegalensis]|uniref:CDP-diacylglycerol--glycerol-3-phosphate 3-phosphatidyltransferase n=1 Tax=Mobilisporobacter senegalensis TaxID=1329262 RepID=A0A3N1XC86_9FIRM|nr:CDP-diacylglycerol--glycerol-3-phosphate 3-phosphatidyltransferase [Mobilisporobacter senegalensis]ROR22377.1 CDP-diacylglycerol--glycerol-3-phosphate 3-phosphatidyltransferase [Mobilisporobacter senegalensis]
MNLPNKITILRVCMIPFFLIFMLIPSIPYNQYIAAVIFVIAALSDAVDGHIARKHNLITNFGKFMDPLADKLLVSAALICFVELRLIPAWIIIIIISREFIISGFRLVASDNGVVIAASYWGKFKTVAQMIMSVLLIVNFDGILFNTAEQILIYASLILTIVSLIDYLWKNRKVLNEGSK